MFKFGLTLGIALWLLWVLTSCAEAPPTVPADFDYDKGYEDTIFPPYCWVQAAHSTLWYVCGHAPGQKDEIPHH